MTAQDYAIRTADWLLNKAGLPVYSDLYANHLRAAEQAKMNDEARELLRKYAAMLHGDNSFRAAYDKESGLR